jgi:hypothetical protein
MYSAPIPTHDPEPRAQSPAERTLLAPAPFVVYQGTDVSIGGPRRRAVSGFGADAAVSC